MAGQSEVYKNCPYGCDTSRVRFLRPLSRSRPNFVVGVPAFVFGSVSVRCVCDRFMWTPLGSCERRGETSCEESGHYITHGDGLHDAADRSIVTCKRLRKKKTFEDFVVRCLDCAHTHRDARVLGLEDGGRGWLCVA